MAELPTGTVTLMFTDIEGSTRVLEELGRERYADALARHRDILRRAFAERGGYEVDYEGDAFFVAFQSAGDAAAAAVAAQRGLAAEHWPDGRPFRVRMGLHTGEPLPVPPKYVGLDVHRAARIMAAAHGGQVLLSERTASLVEEQLPVGVSLLDLGEHRLKDLSSAQRLYQVVLGGLPSDFPPLKTLGNRGTNLPAQPNRLIGRRDELAAISTVLRSRETRLLTLTGPGGTGKTRLALHAGAEILDQFEHGVFVVFLASLSDADLVLPTIAKTLGVREQPGQTLEQTLRAYLRDRELLLILDNLEHLLSAVPQLSQLLADLPALHVVATSREPLRLAAERCFSVPPLATPAHGAETTSALAALGSDAVSLFAERARAADPEFALTDDNAATIAAICARLDGLPLALELAAARVPMFSPQALERRLEQALPLLTGGSRDADERQKTLRAAIAWSYDLLNERDKAVFTRLAIFVGGCRLEAAEAVCDGKLEANVLDALGALVDKNLLRRRDDSDGEPRFWMLATIREFAQERFFEHDGAQATLTRFVAYYVDFAEHARLELERADMNAWFQRLEEEIANLRSALGHARDVPDVRALARLCTSTSLTSFWYTRGYLAEGRSWTATALDLSLEADQGLRAEIFEAAAFFAAVQGDYHEAEELAEQAVVLGRGSLDTEGLVTCLLTKGTAAMRARKFDVAEAALVEALVLSRAESNQEAEARALTNLADLALASGRDEDAAAYAQASLDFVRTHGPRRSEITCLFNLGLAAFFLNDRKTARNRFAETLPLCERLHMPEGIALSLEGLAAVLAADGESERAARLVGHAEMLLDEIGSALGAAERRLHERTMEELRRQLPSEELASEWERGRAMATDDAIHQALTANSVADAPP